MTIKYLKLRHALEATDHHFPCTIPDDIHVYTVGFSSKSVKEIILFLIAPHIESAHAATSQAGEVVKIEGCNFQGYGEVTSVYINGKSSSTLAQFQVESDHLITAWFPKDGYSENEVLVYGPTGYDSRSFTVDDAETDADGGDGGETEPLAANLVFTNTWIEPSEFPKAWSPFRVYFSFANSGGTSTGPFTIRIVLDNAAASTEVAFDSFGPGQSGFVYADRPSGLDVGDHFFYAYLDVFNEVAEVSKEDNVSYHGFQVVQ
jgi:hypothetical protein